MIFGKECETYGWNPLQHAIHNNSDGVVAFMFDYFNAGALKMMMFDSSNWEDAYQVDDLDKDIFGLKICMENLNDHLFNIMWCNDKQIWRQEHAQKVLLFMVSNWPEMVPFFLEMEQTKDCLLYTSPSPRDKRQSRMPSSA